MTRDPAVLAVLAGAVVLLAGITAVRLALRTGLPSLLAYLALGLALGEAGVGVRFDDAVLTEQLGMLALAVILVEGGLTTRWQTLRPALPAAAMLSTVGIALSIAVVGSVVHFGLGLPWRASLLLGAVTAPTDAAAVFATLRGVPLRRRPAAILEAESGTNDPLAVILVLVLSEPHSALSIPGIAATIAYQVAVGALVGALVGTLAYAYLKRVALPSSGLYPLAVLAFGLLAYTGAVAIGASGLLAAYLVGLRLGNATLPHRAAVLGFVEGLTWLAQIGLFVMLGLLASPERLPAAIPTALLAGTALLLVARPLAVLASCLPLRIPLREQAFISWAGLRGAVPIVLATIPMAHATGAERLFDVVFLLVVALTALQAPTLAPLARRLGLVEPGRARDLGVESAPLEQLGADLVDLRIPQGSRLHGAEVWELRLPDTTSVALVTRDGRQLVPDRWERLRAGDHLVIVTNHRDRAAIEAHLAAISEYGPLYRLRNDGDS
ncbi:MAG TPA: potassium/proton antiporter [Frankiaceae bacterium]|nr:potassium/proton antiporter [Frankiaceae bacterium]